MSLTPMGPRRRTGCITFDFKKGWLPREAVVEAGTSEIPFRHEGDKPYSKHSGMKLGIGGEPTIKSDLAKAQFTPTPSDTVHVVDTVAPRQPCEPPSAVLERLKRATTCSVRTVVAAGATTLTRD